MTRPPADPAAMDLRTSLGALVLRTPILTAAGCAGSGRELAAHLDLSRLGGFITPSVTVQPPAGGVGPQLSETPSGLLTSSWVSGSGCADFLAHDLPWLVRQHATVIVSIAGRTIEEFEELAHRLRGVDGVSALELNLSLPNLDSRPNLDAAAGDGRAIPFEASPLLASSVTAQVRRATPSHIPVLPRLTLRTPALVDVARACMSAGADVLSVSGAVPALRVDRSSLLCQPDGEAWLCGPAIRPLALRAVYELRSALPALPILAAGGVMSAGDVVEFLAVGANAVSMGTAVLHDPRSPARVEAELAESCAERGLASVRDLMGAAHRPGPARR